MATPQEFENYFHRRADLAEKLYAESSRNEAVLVATVALDALATICEHDRGLKGESSDLRLAKFVQRYAGDLATTKIAVVFLAEDMRRMGPQRLSVAATRLLERRNAEFSRPESMEFRATPHSYLDKDWDALVAEEPSLASEPAIEKLASRYTYPALLYRLWRCGIVHGLSRGTRTSDFSSIRPDDEISYFPAYVSGSRTRPISLKLGLLVITGWVRRSTTAYVQECVTLGIEPARSFDPSEASLRRLYDLWKKVSSP